MRQLGDFIRLADYMCVSNCYLLTLASCERLLETLTTPRKNGLWITSVEYGDDDMIFSPPLKSFTASVTQMLELMVSNIHAVPRLLYMRPFKPYFQSGRVEGPDVAKLVRHATHWTQMQKEIESVITTDFTRATGYAQQFEEYRVIFVFGEYWCARASPLITTHHHSSPLIAPPRRL